MPWQDITRWFQGRRRLALTETMPLTLVTLTVVANASADELAFYSAAEYAALVEWAKLGRFILALAAEDRGELILLCTEGADVIRPLVEDLPMVSAGLARFDIRVVMPLRLIDLGDAPVH